MTLFRTIFVASTALLAAPAFAATGPFAVTAQDAPRGTIMVIDAAQACVPEAAAAHAALAAQAGRAIGVVATESCGAAEAMMAAAPDLAFADDAAALGAEPNAFLAANRERGIYVWDMDAYRALDLSGRQVLGVFSDQGAAKLIDAALAHLSARRDGWFLLVQAGALDAEARASLDGARRGGAEILTPGLIHNADFSALD